MIRGRVLRIALLVMTAVAPLGIAEAQPARPVYREIRVPPEEIGDWLARGEWETIGREAFDNLIRRSTPAGPIPPDAWIASAAYTATLSDDVLQSGSFIWDVRLPVGDAGLLRLDPIGLALDDLRWDSDGVLGRWLREPAVWGAARNGTLNLLVDRLAGDVRGTWNLRGRRIGRNLEFQLNLAPAAISELRLNLPPELAVTASTGTVVSSDKGGQAPWRVVLGSQTSTKLTIGPPDQMAIATPLLLAETDTLFLARRDGLRIQAGVRVEVLRSSVQTVSISLPADVQVYSVRYARETSLSWKTAPHGSLQRLTIDLPDRLSGSSRSISIDATAPAPVGRPVALPVPVVENAIFQSGQLRLIVEKPLELQDYDLDGCREVEALSANNDGEAIAFEQTRPAGQVTVTISDTPVKLAARMIQLIELEPETWRLRAEIEWRTRSGRTFSVQMRIPPGWNVTHVRPADSGSSLVNQQTIADNGVDRLVLEFHQAVAEDGARRIQVYAERPPPAAARQPDLPLILPEDVTELETMVGISRAASARPPDVGSSNLQSLPAGNLPEFARSSALWQSVVAGTSGERTPAWLIFRSHALAPAGRLGYAGGDEPVEAPRPAIATGRAMLPPTRGHVGDSGGAAPSSEPAAVMRVQSILAAGDGFDRHRVRYSMQPHPAAFPFSFRLPPGAELLGVKVGDDFIAVRSSANSYSLPDFPPNRGHELEILYRSPTATGFLRSSHELLLPDAPLTTIGFDWQCATPPAWELLRGVDSVAMNQGPMGLPWTKRMFGPLGRRAEESAFNPLDMADWRRAIQGDAPSAAAAAGTSAAQSHAPETFPAGWHVWSATALEAPPSLTITLWSPADARALAWVAILGSMIVIALARVQARSGRTRFGFLAAAGLLLAAFLLPADRALICGGAFLGILVAGVLPRRWLRPMVGWTNARAVGTDTTQSARPMGAGTATILVLVALLAWNVHAQEPTASNSESGPDVELETAVLVPVGVDHQPRSDLPNVYVARTLLQQLERTATQQPQPPGYLIESAEYRGRVDDQGSTALEAAFRLVLLDRRRTVRIDLPIIGAFPSGTPACRVNGAPHALLVGDDGRTLVLEWDGEPNGTRAATFLHVAIPLQATRIEPPRYGDLALTIPWAGCSRVELDFAERQSDADFLDAVGKLELRADGHRVVADLGPSNRLVGAWSDEPAAAAAMPVELHSRVYSLVQVHPARLDYQCRIVARVEPGALERMEWVIPESAFVRQVIGDDLAGFTVTPISPDDSRLSIEFARPRTGEFHVDVSLLLPVSEASPSIPVGPILLDSPVGEQAVRVETREIGIIAPSEFQMQATVPAGNSATQIPTAAFLQAFARTGEPPAGLREPLAAWRLAEPVTLTVSLQPHQPARRVRMRQTGTVLEGELRWTARAEVELHDAPAWRHSVLLDPRMIVDSVSVRHDEAERLVRWSRAEERLELFLRDQSVGIQDVVLRGRVPIDNAGQSPLPLVTFKDSTVLESRLDLDAAPNVQAELEPVEGVTPEASPNGGDNSSDAEEGLLAIGRFRLAPALATMPRLRWQMRPPVADTERARAAVTLPETASSSDGPLTPARPESGGIRAAAIETELQIAEDGRRLGRTKLVSESSTSRQAAFFWPAALRLRAALVDGEPALARLVRENESPARLIIERPDAGPWREVTLSWEQGRPQTLHALGPLVQSLPAAAAPAARESAVSITLPEQFETLSPDRVKVSVDQRSAELRLWAFDRRWLNVALVVLGAVVALWLSSRLARLAPGEHLARHPLAAVLLIGILWWLCLAPGVLGFLLAVGTVLFGAGRLFWRQPEPERSRQTG